MRNPTTVRLPVEVLKGLKARALEEGKSLNRMFLEMARECLRRRPHGAAGIPPQDPLWQIGRHPGRPASGRTDGAEHHDEYLYGPVRWKPGR